MRIWSATAFILVFTAVAHAQQTSPAADFFMRDRSYDTFLYDHYRFGEPKPLRIEYWYVNWLDSSEGTDEYREHLHLGGALSVYKGQKLTVDTALQYLRVPIWAEAEEDTFGNTISTLYSHLTAQWTITDRLKSVVGWEYNLKGDRNKFGARSGTTVCPLKAFLSYDLHTQLNFVAGGRFDRYYYDTYEKPDISSELANRLYCRPAIMLNWHPSDNFIVLLGIPGAAVHLALGDVLKSEIRLWIDKRIEAALRVRPFEGTSATVRFLNTPYTEIPITDRSFYEDRPLAERLFYTARSIYFEIGHELNPAALASLGFLYGLGGDVEFKDGHYNDIVELDGKSHFAIGATFTVDLEVLLRKR